jgi:hypothetical protein
MKCYLKILIAAMTDITLSSCNKFTSGSGLSAYHTYDLPASLPRNPSAVRVKVSLRKQLIYVMEGSKPLLVTPCTVGAAGTPTPQGNFKIILKNQYKRANSHGWAYNGKDARKANSDSRPAGWSFKGTPMPYWCEFKTNYGFHTGWVKHYPSSHGCIRLHENIAPKFFRLVSIGTPVNIASSQPEDASIGQGIKIAPDAGPLPDYHSSMYLGNGYFSRHKTPTYE